MPERPPFHLAIPVTNLESARHFYETVLGCRVGRTDKRWIDFNMSGHQLTVHLSEHSMADLQCNQVDGKDVPVLHFGVVLPWDEWHVLSDRLQKDGMPFVIEPHIRFQGQVGEQATMFFKDPCGNALEFKSFRDPESLFQS